jgi:major membrane immunogen (membrane-anchored lipoprotein)
MRKSLKLCGALLLSTLLISCGSSDEDTVKKYLPGTYTRHHKEGESIGFGYHKEITIKHLQGNEYRISCISNDKKNFTFTPDVFDFEISSINLNQKTDSVEKYFIKGIITNIVSDGTTFSAADNGINNTNILNFVIGKNTVEVNLGGNGLLSIKKK